MMTLTTALLLVCALSDIAFGIKAGGWSTELGRLYYAFGAYIVLVQIESWLARKAVRS